MNLRERTERETAWLRKYDEGYQAEELILGITEAVESIMREQGITRSALADRLSVSPAQVSKLLNADSTNFTVKTLARIAWALNVKLAWDFEPLMPLRTSWSCGGASAVTERNSEELLDDAFDLAA